MAARIGTAHRDIVAMIIRLHTIPAEVLWADAAPDPESRPEDPFIAYPVLR
jgi:hypothetical protein